MMFVLLLCAKPIFVLLYSDRWLDSVPYFQVLCIAGLAFCLQSVNYQSIAAIGKSRTMFWWTMIKRVVGICFVVAGLVLYGMKGLLIGVVVNTWFSYFVNISLVSRHIGYKWWNQLRDIAPVLFASATAAAISYGVSEAVGLSLYLDGVLKMLVCMSLYGLWSVLFKPEAYKYTMSIIRPTFQKINSKKSQRTKKRQTE